MVEGLKILVLLFYCNRPKLILNCLRSIQVQTYTNYEIALIDDSPECPAKPIVQEYFKDQPEVFAKFKFYETMDYKEQKEARGDSIFGKFANQAIEESTADLVLMLCDDDGFIETYLNDLNEYFLDQPETNYSFSHLILFNPIDEDFEEILKRREASPYLNIAGWVNPICRVDSSQVTWRRKCNIEGDCWFPWPQTVNLDASIYSRFMSVYGECCWNGLCGVLKGWANNIQLGHRPARYDGFE